MKKIMMIAAMMVATLSASAQIWVGGGVGFSTRHINGIDGNTKMFVIAPEVGYNLNDKFSIAAKLGYEYSNSYELKGKTLSVNTWTINPYARYSFVKVGNFSAFVDGGLFYATSHIQGAKNNANVFGVNINPGIAYNVSDKVTLAAHFGKGLYFEYDWMKDNTRTNEVGLELLNGISFSAYYNF